MALAFFQQHQHTEPLLHMDRRSAAKLQLQLGLQLGQHRPREGLRTPKTGQQTP